MCFLRVIASMLRRRHACVWRLSFARLDIEGTCRTLKQTPKRPVLYAGPPWQPQAVHPLTTTVVGWAVKSALIPLDFPSCAVPLESNDVSCCVETTPNMTKLSSK